MLTYGDLDGSVKHLAVMLVNRGSFTITRVEMRFSYDGRSLVSHRGYEHLSCLPSGLPEKLRHGWTRSPEQASYAVLAPGMRGCGSRAMTCMCST